jgi:6-phosphogluconolactonase (cycloisomerase 2 family)
MSNNNFKKSFGKDVSVKYVKCNNINVNVNGLELDVIPPFLADNVLAAEAVEGNTDPSSIGGNNVDGSQINDFRFICINNNNNTVTEVEEVEEPLPQSQDTTMYVTNFRDNTVEIYDINDPTAPVRVGQFNGGNLNLPTGILAQGTTLYVANLGENTVEIYDINNPTAPVREGQFGAGDLNVPFGIAARGTTLYVTNQGDNTIEIYDINNPTAPVREGQFNGGNLNVPAFIAIQGPTL